MEPVHFEVGGAFIFANNFANNESANREREILTMRNSQQESK